MTLTRCSPLVSLNSLPSFRPPSTPTLQARPSLNVFGCYKCVFEKTIHDLPVLKPNLVYGPSSSGCNFCHRIPLFLVVVVVPHLTHCGHILLHDCKIVQVSVPTACSPNMSLVSAAGINRQETRAMCEQYTWGQSPTSIETKTHNTKQLEFSIILCYQISKRVQILTQQIWGKAFLAEAAPAVWTECIKEGKQNIETSALYKLH